ncbi:MAG: NERD domain-containing protein [Verrucomicrobiales bacterium]|nr:NERD domain-containing protein [Verrucomicrobiales bacterium]
MARWYYNRPSECCDESEVKVATKLRRLSKRWTIRWGFYYEDNKGVRREGDFLLFDPMHGLLVLEVKGFRMRGFAPTGKWEGDPTKSKDHPLYQLDQEFAAVLKALEAVQPGWRPVAKALCLPNEVIPEGQKTYQDIPRELIVDGRDLEKIDSIFGRFFDGEQPRNIKQHRDVFLQTYGKGGSPEELKHFIDHNEVIFRKQLTRQYQLLDILEGNQQLFIEGGAGTGKTWNAVEKAVRLAEGRPTEAGEGAEVLLLCYNIALGRFLQDLVGRRKLERGSVSVYQWEELANHILSACGMENEIPSPDSPREEKLRYYDQDLPGLLLECVREEEFADRLPRFDALVVDEAQDHDTSFPEALNDAGPHTDRTDARCGWWSIYFALLNDGTKAPATLFFDSAQRPPFRGSGGFDAQILAEQFSQPAFARLPHALRYTQPIFDFLQTLNAPGTERLIDQLCEPDDLPEGPEVVTTMLDSPTPDATREAVESIIATWVEDGYCKAEEILLLHARTHLKDSALGSCDSLAGLPLHEYGAPLEENTKAIRHLSINRAKGLDALGVILIGVRPFQEIQTVDHQYTYFMGASRAKQLLAVVHR